MYMTTFVTLQNNVATNVNRTDFTTQIKLAINRAIKFYSRTNRFWFNETTGTFNTVASQFAYGSADSVPTNILKLDDVTVTIASTDIPVLQRRTLDWVLKNNLSRVTGTPTDYAYFQNKFYISLIPDAVYVITLYYVKSYSDLSADADTNDFTDNAEDLIEARATWWVYSKLLRNQEAATAAKAEELEALSALQKQTERLISTGRVVISSF